MFKRLFKKKYRLFVPAAGADTGGPNTFLANLNEGLRDRGFSFHNDPSARYDSFFFPIAYDLRTLEALKKRGVRLIQRLDGIYYPSKHGEKYIELNSQIKEIYLNLADEIIFQSEYSEKMCREVLGVPGAQRIYTIVNGASEERYYPETKERLSSNTFTFVTTGNFRNLDMIEPVIQAMDEMDFPFRLIIAGPIANPELKSFFQRSYVEHRGDLDAGGVAAVLRESDVFIYSHLNPPCPNSVIEAICCGLPVVGFASGAMEELCGFNRELLAPVSGQVLQEYRNFDYRKLKEKIELSVRDLDKYKRRALENAGRYTLKRMVDEYLRIFEAD